MHLALYRAERPEYFEEIIGQKHIVKILQNQIKNNSVSQAYLFAGTRGTGKTTTARILAKAVNCLGERKPCGECANCKSIKEGTFLDVIELDAASNNGVEDLRSLIDSVKYPPAVGKYKVYIIDEVHMLSQSAENAFLKTLEEPPEYAIFILATTDPEKVRATIRSRCMTLNFKRVSENDLTAGMKRICTKKGIDIQDDALETIAAKSDGSVRDALSILEQCISAGDELVTKDIVLDYIGSAGDDFYLSLTEAIASKDHASALEAINKMIADGKDAKQMLNDWLMHYRNLMIVKYVDNAERIVNASEENTKRLAQQAEKIGIKEIDKAIRKLSEYVNMGRYSSQPRLLLEVAAIELMEGGEATPKYGDSSRNNVSSRYETVRPVKSQVKREDDENKQSQRQAIEPQTQSSIPEDQVNVKEYKDEEDIDTKDKDSKDKAADKVQTAEHSNDLAGMWEAITAEVGKHNMMFKAVVGKNSEITSFKDNRMLITVKENKYALAEQEKDNIIRVAKSLYGDQVRVTLKAGVIGSTVDKPSGNGKIQSENQDGNEATEIDVEAIAKNAEKVLGGIDIKIK